MNYIVTKFAGCLFDGEIRPIKPNLKYEIDNVGVCLFFGNNGEVPFSLNLKEGSCGKVQKVKVKNDTYHFIFPSSINSIFSTVIKYKNKDVVISLTESLNISIKGEILLDRQVCDLKYSCFEIKGNILLIYFSGKRNFVVVLQDEEVKYADYYDECNIDGENILFMIKLHDTLNHGRVCEIKQNIFESYLVYLDDEELCLKDEFLASVFVDCLIAGNYKYCNELLTQDLRCDKSEKIKEFFPQFDHFFVDNNIIILFQKNTLAGAFEFEILEHKITNIKCL